MKRGGTHITSFLTWADAKQLLHATPCHVPESAQRHALVAQMLDDRVDKWAASSAAGAEQAFEKVPEIAASAALTLHEHMLREIGPILAADGPALQPGNTLQYQRQQGAAQQLIMIVIHDNPPRSFATIRFRFGAPALR